MLKCRDVAELVASDAWQDPPLTRRVAVLMHLAMCGRCRAYVRHLGRIGAAARRLFNGGGVEADFSARIAVAVREAAASAQSQNGPDPQ